MIYSWPPEPAGSPRHAPHTLAPSPSAAPPEPARQELAPPHHRPDARRPPLRGEDAGGAALPGPLRAGQRPLPDAWGRGGLRRAGGQPQRLSPRVLCGGGAGALAAAPAVRRRMRGAAARAGRGRRPMSRPYWAARKGARKTARKTARAVDYYRIHTAHGVDPRKTIRGLQSVSLRRSEGWIPDGAGMTAAESAASRAGQRDARRRIPAAPMRPPGPGAYCHAPPVRLLSSQLK